MKIIKIMKFFFPVPFWRLRKVTMVRFILFLASFFFVPFHLFVFLKKRKSGLYFGCSNFVCLRGREDGFD